MASRERAIAQKIDTTALITAAAGVAFGAGVYASNPELGFNVGLESLFLGSAYLLGRTETYGNRFANKFAAGMLMGSASLIGTLQFLHTHTLPLSVESGIDVALTPALYATGRYSGRRQWLFS